MQQNNIIYFPDMTKNYRQELDNLLYDIVDKAIDGKKLAEINSLLWLANKQDGLPINTGHAVRVRKAGINFKLETARGEK